MTAADSPQDPTWPLTEEFDRVARRPGRPPDPGMLSALATWASDDVVAALLESHAALCIGEQVPEAENYAAHLTALADLLEPDGRRGVLAAIDVSAAELYERTGRHAEALRRAQRCGDDLAEFYPGLLGDREWVLACVAGDTGRRADARAHATRARDLFAADERWVEAAGAAEAAAGTHERITPEGVDDWRRAAGLYVVAGEPDDARECAGQVCFEIGKAWSTFVMGDEADVARACADAAALAHEHGLVTLAVRLDTLAAAMTIDSGAPFEEVAARLAQGRRALATLDRSDDERRLDEARLDLYLGLACQAHSRWAEAERLISGALPVLRTLGDPDEATMAEDVLRGVLAGMSNGRLGAAEVTNDGLRLMIEGARLAEDGRLDAAVACLARARNAAAEGDDPHLPVVVEAFSALLRLASGDRAAVDLTLARVEAHLATFGDRVPRSRRIMLTLVAGMLRTVPAASDGRTDDIDTAYAATEADLSALGAGPGAALVAVGRARSLLAAGRPREALDVGLPATLALDALRCTLPDAHRRSLWSGKVAEGLDTAVRAAAACRDTVLLAELLEVARGNAVPLPRAADDRTDAVSALSAAMAPESDGGETAVRPGPAAAAGGEERTALGLPAFVRTPWDTVALGAALESARRYLDPVRVEVTVEWRVREPAGRTP